MNNGTQPTHLAGSALKGAVAGAIGVWVMDRVDWFMYNNEDPAARQRTHQVRPGGVDPAHVAVNRLAEMAGTELSPRQPHPAGVGLHYAIGIGPAAIYGAARKRIPAITAGKGALYGLALFVAQDEILNSLMGLSAKPREYPWQAHARGLVAHLVYGLVTETILNLTDTTPPVMRAHA